MVARKSRAIGHCWLKGWLEFNVPFQHKNGYIRDEWTKIDVITGSILLSVTSPSDDQFSEPTARLDSKCVIESLLKI